MEIWEMSNDIDAIKNFNTVLQTGLEPVTHDFWGRSLYQLGYKSISTYLP